MLLLSIEMKLFAMKSLSLVVGGGEEDDDGARGGFVVVRDWLSIQVFGRCQSAVASRPLHTRLLVA